MELDQIRPEHPEYSQFRQLAQLGLAVPCNVVLLDGTVEERRCKAVLETVKEVRYYPESEIHLEYEVVRLVEATD